MHRPRPWLPFGLLVVLVGFINYSAQPTLAVPVQVVDDAFVYADRLSSGWHDWSWGGIVRNFTARPPTHSGTASISVTPTAGWSGLKLARFATDPVDISGYNTFRFWIHGGTLGRQQLSVQVGNASCNVAQPIVAQAEAWMSVDIQLCGVSPAEVTYVTWFNATAQPQATFYLDDLAFVTSDIPMPAPPVPGPLLSVDAAADQHAISPYIYGMNHADEALAAELRLSVRRWGGNSTSRYNWRLDTHNTGSDWYFENIPNANPAPENLPNGSTVDRFVEQDHRTGTETLLTIPLIGWTPKARPDDHPYDCGFPVSEYGPQKSVDPYDPNCGNGKYVNGAPITTFDPSLTSTRIDPSFVQAWIRHLIGRYGTAADGGVALYNLDNEPMLWNSTHRDVHPHGTTYDELRDRTYQYAAALKAVDPSAQTLGPVEWGWCGYLDSAAKGGQCFTDTGGPDRQAHGNLPLVAWYLQQMRAYEQAHGQRILDYLDLHYYPQATGVALSCAGNTVTQELRLRSTRSLWDHEYRDESWIGRDLQETVELIPRMRSWVQNNYPGTKLAISEYNWGAFDHINGALAQADVLGIFGREGLDLATLWQPQDPKQPPIAKQPGVFAFRMYRNYDGAGNMFGETSVRANSAAEDTLASYAARRNSDGALTIMVINKKPNGLFSRVALSNFNAGGHAQVYRYSASHADGIVREPNQRVEASGFSATFPAESITLFVMADQGENAVAYLPSIQQ